MRYPGGKNGSGVYQRLINLMPPHRQYVEAFLGSGAILRHKRPAETNVGVGLDSAALVAVMESGVPNLQLVCMDALEWIDAHCRELGPDTLLYLDPPYLMSTRSCRRPLYQHEFGSIPDHRRLLDRITGLSCMVMISGYYSDLYAEALTGWRSISFQAITRGGTMATEWVWMNFPKPVALHDYQFLGENFRERERIRRRQNRWKARLERMTDLERYAMLAAIQELQLPTP